MITLNQGEAKISSNDGMWTVLYGLGGGKFTSKWARSERRANEIVEQLRAGVHPNQIGSGRE